MTVAVPAVSMPETLDEFRPTVIACDIEGGEVELFRNIRLDTVNKTVMELHEYRTGLAGIKSLFDFMSGRGLVYDQAFSSGAVVVFKRS